MSARNLFLLGALTAASAIHAPLAAQASNLPAPDCAKLAGIPTTHPGSYTLEKKKDPAVLAQEVTLADKMCTGAKYVFTVSSLNGRSLGWNTSYPGSELVATDSSGGTTATITFSGDGATQTFSFKGTTDPSYTERERDSCVQVTLSVTILTETWTYPYNEQMEEVVPAEYCTGGTGAGSMSG